MGSCLDNLLLKSSKPAKQTQSNPIVQIPATDRSLKPEQRDPSYPKEHHIDTSQNKSFK